MVIANVTKYLTAPGSMVMQQLVHLAGLGVGVGEGDDNASFAFFSSRGGGSGEGGGVFWSSSCT